MKNYQQNSKLFAIAGIKRETKEPRDSGVYWKYHESGSTPDGYRRVAPKRFLKTAKEKNFAQLEKEIGEAFGEIREIHRRRS